MVSVHYTRRSIPVSTWLKMILSYSYIVASWPESDDNRGAYDIGNTAIHELIILYESYYYVCNEYISNVHWWYRSWTN